MQCVGSVESVPCTLERYHPSFGQRLVADLSSDISFHSSEDCSPLARAEQAPMAILVDIRLLTACRQHRLVSWIVVRMMQDGHDAEEQRLKQEMQVLRDKEPFG